ncbi:MAG: fimbrillin family protein, partial [Alistipes sp.]|nr:fimbrillin family protein [Alistipes sp.]
MKTSNLFIAILATLLLLSCGKSDNNGQLVNNQQVTVSANITNYTRAGYENGVLLPEKFVMDIIQGVEDRFDYSLVEMTKSTGANLYFAPNDVELLWASHTHSATVKALTIPFGLNEVKAEGVMAIGVSLSQNYAHNVAASDLLGASSLLNEGITINGNNINIEFKHLLSKLDVKIKFASEFDENSVAINSMVLQNICTSGGYSYAEMDYDATNLKYGDITMYYSADASKAEAIFYPYNPTSNPTLLIDATIDNVDYTFTCPVVPNSAEG